MTNSLNYAPVEFKYQETALGTWKKHLNDRGQLFEEFVSHRKVFGLPLVHYTRGRNPLTGKGEIARGVFAVGRIAVGIFPVGQLAIGICPVGQLSIGLLFGAGQMATGLVAIGQLALGGFLGIGQFATGFLAIGQMGMGYHTIAQVPGRIVLRSLSRFVLGK
ncbi:MAG: hypothetical protein M3O30_12965 [Planctomycetota bacterium]|nr:hypothetical protein [Planctomycetota bacterium]